MWMEADRFFKLSDAAKAQAGGSMVRVTEGVGVIGYGRMPDDNECVAPLWFRSGRAQRETRSVVERRSDSESDVDAADAETEMELAVGRGRFLEMRVSRGNVLEPSTLPQVLPGHSPRL